MAVKMAKGLRGRRRAVRPERAVSCSWSRLQELVPRGGPSKHVPAAEWVISCRTESLGKKKKKEDATIGGLNAAEIVFSTV